MNKKHSAILVGVVLAAGGAMASAGPNEGGFQIRPKVGLAATYDSNIFLAPENAVAAWVAEPQLSVGLGFRGKRSNLQGGYEVTPRIYSEYQQVNNAVHQTFMLTCGYEFKPGGLIGLDDLFRITSDPATSELTRRALRNQNDVAFMLDMPVGPKLYVGLRVTDTIHHYRSSASPIVESGLAWLLDRNELMAGVRLGVRSTEKTKIYGFYKMANVDFKKNDVNDSKGNLLGAGIEGDLTARLTGIVEANSVSRKYSETITGEPNEYTTGGFSTTLKWKAPSDWVVAISGARGFQESVFNRYYMTNNGSISVTKPVGKRFEAQVQGSYGADQYPGARAAFLMNGTPLTARRKDTNISAGLKLTYVLLPRQTVSAHYLLRQRTSNFDTYNYTDSTVTLSADYTF